MFSSAVKVAETGHFVKDRIAENLAMMAAASLP
jgi:hypothetical protein